MADDVPAHYRTAAVDLLGELGLVVAQVLVERAGMTEPDANRIGTEAAARVARQWAGTQLYFPLGLVTDERDWMIYQEFDGTNVKDLAKRYRISEAWVYQIIKRIRTIDVGRRQADLFPANDQGGLSGTGS